MLWKALTLITIALIDISNKQISPSVKRIPILKWAWIGDQLAWELWGPKCDSHKYGISMKVFALKHQNIHSLEQGLKSYWMKNLHW
jgi:hypothetical protein